MEIIVAGEKGIRVPRKLLTQVAKKVLLSLAYKKNKVELSILIVKDKAIKKLNNDYRGKNKATDVLSFGVPVKILKNNPICHIGDVVISIETAKRYATEAGHSLSCEFVNLLVHGILHLHGYDHENVSENKAKKMMKIQEELIQEVCTSERIKR